MEKESVFNLVGEIEMLASTSRAIADFLMTHYEDLGEGPDIDPKDTCLILHQISKNMQAVVALVGSVIVANKGQNVGGAA